MHSRFFITFNPPRATLYLAGELDVTERAELHRRIEDAVVLGCVRLEVDGAAVTFIDVGCLSELDAGRTGLATLGRSLVVRRTSPVFERVANLSGYRSLLTEPQTSGSSAPVTAPDGRTAFGRPRPPGRTRPAHVGYRERPSNRWLHPKVGQMKPESMEPERSDCTCPAQARAILDRLEAKVAATPAPGSTRPLQDDWVPSLPGAGEPPD